MSDHNNATTHSDTSTEKPSASRLQFSKDELPPPDPKLDKKIDKLKSKVGKTDKKMSTAKDKLPKKRRIKVKTERDPNTAKPKRRLHFEEEVKSKAEHIKGAPITRPVKVAGNTLLGVAHSKVYQVEQDNTGLEAAHKGEVIAEGGVRRAYHRHKTAPYRRVEKLQKLSQKRHVNLTYQETLKNNPKANSNMMSRFIQKQKIKRQYAKVARETKRAGTAAKKTGDAVVGTGKAAVAFAKSHPTAALVIGLLALLLLIIMSMFGSCSNMGAGVLSSVVSTSYLASDSDIDDAELVYTEWETDLQIEINNTESTHTGYDEYRYNIADIGHNPYELMAYLTAKYSEFSYSQVLSELQTVFNLQYKLTYTQEVEIRYRTEYYTDENGDLQSEQVPYEWHILHVNLTARSFTDVVSSRMNSEQNNLYGVLMVSGGNRQYSNNPFAFNWLPYVSSYYGWRVHPISGDRDYHTGIDIALPTGTQIIAGHDGVVTEATYDADGYGRYVTIEGEDGLSTRYAHCDVLQVSVGDTISEGDPIATVGNTGNSTGPHLHFEVMKDGRFINPIYFAVTGDDGTGALPGSPSAPIIPPDPGGAMGDGSYSALIETAERYLGFPYVFGGSTPATSFDCSGFVCWVYTQSGVYNLPRTTAQGIYNQCTPISAENAQPGDLIFFHSTYSTPSTVTHVGIYVGGGMMLHCGDPISYASINTSYWQEHFYAFGRLN